MWRAFDSNELKRRKMLLSLIKMVFIQKKNANQTEIYTRKKKLNSTQKTMMSIEWMKEGRKSKDCINEEKWRSKSILCDECDSGACLVHLPHIQLFIVFNAFVNLVGLEAFGGATIHDIGDFHRFPGTEDFFNECEDFVRRIWFATFWENRKLKLSSKWFRLRRKYC